MLAEGKAQLQDGGDCCCCVGPQELEKKRAAEQKLAEEKAMLERVAKDVKKLDAKWDEDGEYTMGKEIVPQLLAPGFHDKLDTLNKERSLTDVNELIGFQVHAQPHPHPASFC
eukprot:1196380-Prorocentrum_minimum.AAC.12